MRIFKRLKNMHSFKSMLPFYKDDVNEVQAGIDEVGRGAFMGPVVASAVVWDNNWLTQNMSRFESQLNNIKDSKKLSEKKREQSALFIKEFSKAYAIESVDEYEIDRKNILCATIEAMHKCIDKLTIIGNVHINRLLVDGNHFKPYKDIPFDCVTSGDNHFLNIASASILAKVYRDNLIKDLCKRFPEYQLHYEWENNKGYGTKKHIEGIRAWGITPFHRKTFGICKTFN